MNNAELVNAVARKLDVPFYVAEKSVSVLLETITEELVKGTKIKFVDFGSFEVVRRAPRKGHNPRTGEEILIPDCNEPVFKPGKALKELINK